MKTVEVWNDKNKFDEQCNSFLNNGFELKSCSTGMAFTTDGGSCDTVYQAIFHKQNILIAETFNSPESVRP
jgi:hypothetical protein